MIIVNVKQLSKATWAVVAIAAVAYKAFDTSIQVKKYEVATDKVKESIRIVFVSDLHNNTFGQDQSCLKELISEQKPDLVLLGGDIYDYVGQKKHASVLLRWLGQTVPTYYVTGNHELRMDELEGIKAKVRSLGIKVLEGDSEVFTVGRSRIIIHGVDDARDKARFKKQLKKVGKNLDSNEFNLLLSHRPEKVNYYEKYPFDLILSGHAHGGQWRVPGLINGVYSPQQGFLPKYAGGEYELDNEAKMIVGRGLMIKHQKFPRIFNPPELIVIDIERD